MPISIKFILIVSVVFVAATNRWDGGGPIIQDINKPGKKGKRINYYSNRITLAARWKINKALKKAGIAR